MKIHEIKEMNNDELVKRIEEEEINLVDLRFQHQLKQLTNTSKLKLTKRDIARMKTLLNERLTAEKSSKQTKEGAIA
ncbi:MAG: 50S ribosomal protein L29 [Syntrophothermus sp.]